MKKEFYLSILSGQQRGALFTLIRLALSALTFPYMVVLAVRNALYTYGIIKSHRLPVYTISIGNITTGGTGKTPFVVLVAKYLKGKTRKVAILSRGYGGRKTSLINNDKLFEEHRHGPNEIINDEYLMLKECLNDVQILLGSDRVQNGRKAIKDYSVDCLILDDGFQHLKLKRDLDIVVIDALNPFAGERLIPRGMLRGPIKDLCRADLFVISHCDLIDEHDLKSIYKRLKQINSDVPVCEAIHKPVLLENIKDSSNMKIEWLKGKRVYGVCAIGNPGSFEATLQKLGADLIKFQTYDDHHIYSQKEIDCISSDAGPLGVDAVVVTQKDIVKIKGLNINDANIMSLNIEMQIIKGMEHFKEAMAKII